MNSPVLVAYATKHGSTREIADRIGDALQKAGLDVDVLPVEDVGDVTRYGSAVIGTAVYMGRWRKAARKFLIQNQLALSWRPVWLFESGPTGEGDPVELVEGHVVPPSLREIVDRIKPRDIAVFHGKLDEEQLNVLEKWVINTVGADVGDFRNWDAIESWAQEIAGELKDQRAA